MTHGGKRPGTGPKSSPSPYGEATKVIRIPISRIDEIRAYLKACSPLGTDSLELVGTPLVGARSFSVPLFAARVPAGFPSPAHDYAEGQLDLNEYLIEHEAATFFVRVKGNSMTEAGILEGDIIIVDRALEPRNAIASNRGGRHRTGVAVPRKRMIGGTHDLSLNRME
jgi:DNA polymerase V